MISTTPFTLYVNTSDGFEDCWDPFFTLLKKYWPACTAPIFLNTEVKRYHGPHEPIHSTCVQGSSRSHLTWSECLLAGLDQVRTPLVLYMQEDYFIDRPVLHDRVMAAAELMLERPDIQHIGLTKQGSHGPFSPDTSGMLRIDQKARYRISTQAGLWRVPALMSYLVPRENGWMFEIYGTWRAQRREACFLTANVDPALGGPPIDYLHTGIIKGQWLPEIGKVFKANGIEVDLTKRGLYRPKHPLFRRIETARRLARHPLYLLRQLL